MGAQERERVLQALRRDPTLRYTDSGRATLAWLCAHVLGIDHGHRFVDGFPSHCLDRIAELAHGCAEEWKALADEVEARARRQQYAQDAGQDAPASVRRAAVRT